MINDKDIKITDKHIFFCGSWLSNWYKSTIELEDIFCNRFKFDSSGHFFMWRKAMEFKDTEIANKILTIKNPIEVKKLCKQIHNFNDKQWNKVKYDIMFTANIHKYNQNEELLQKLCSDKFQDKTFVEASYDKIWGIGMSINDIGVDDESNWKGQNLFGKCITEVRNTFV